MWFVLLLGIVILCICLFLPVNISDRICYVSMTTLPERLVSDYFKEVVESILDKNIEYLIINVPYVCERSNEKYITLNGLEIPFAPDK